VPFNKLVHIVDDDEHVRASTAFLLAAEDFTVKTWKSGVVFLEAAQHAQEGCVLLDIRMPDMDGLEVQEQLRARGNNLPVIMYTEYGDIAAAVKAMRAGAVTFLEKPVERADLLDAIRLGFEHLKTRNLQQARADSAARMVAMLSARERDVLRCLTRGLPNKFIAYDLDISPRTVEIHRANLMSKLQVRTLSAALQIALAAGLDGEPPCA
jgi:two-component system response regulator FixJ